MNSQAVRGLYITVGAALGALAIRALVARRLRRSGTDEASIAEWAEDSEVPTPPIPDQLRQEVASLVAPHVWAPDRDAMGEELMADSMVTGTLEVGISDDEDADAEADLTARPNEQAPQRDDAYDAVAPDDLGSEWLTRATEVSSFDSSDSSESQPPEAFLEGGMSGMSEGSLNAANADEIEANASADLDDDYVPVDLGELRKKEG